VNNLPRVVREAERPSLKIGCKSDALTIMSHMPHRSAESGCKLRDLLCYTSKACHLRRSIALLNRSPKHPSGDRIFDRLLTAHHHRKFRSSDANMRLINSQPL